MPPAPSGATISYGPRRVPASNDMLQSILAGRTRAGVELPKIRHLTPSSGSGNAGNVHAQHKLAAAPGGTGVALFADGNGGL